MEKNITINVLRNSLELEPKKIVLKNDITVSEFLKIVISEVSKETSEKYYYRFRHTQKRLNGVIRPSVVFSDVEMRKTMFNQFPSIEYIYLEQSLYSSFGGTECFYDLGDMIVTIRKWDKDKRIPVTVGDYIIHSFCTFRDFKQLISMMTGIYIKDMLLVEEESPNNFIIFNYPDHHELHKLFIKSGDIIYVEALSEKHLLESKSYLPEIVFSFIEEYYKQQGEKQLSIENESVDLKEQKKEIEKDGKECKICFISSIDTVIIPCGHMVMKLNFFLTIIVIVLCLYQEDG